MRKSFFIFIFGTLLAALCTAACDDSDGDADGDVDTDGDADMDGDSDSDAGGDADADGDGDSDADGDADADSDGDSDVDGDADADGDGGSDGDLDDDGDAETSAPFVCGETLRDARNGREYSTVTIGSQCWMGENLYIGEYVESRTGMGAHSDLDHSDHGDPDGIQFYCWENDPTNCDAFGAMYDWDEAMRGSHAEGARGICPEGWHIPSDAEFHTMAHELDTEVPAEHTVDLHDEAPIGRTIGRELKEGGSSGFNWLIAGRRFEWGNFPSIGITYLWTSTEYDDDLTQAFLWEAFTHREDCAHPYHPKIVGSYLRCVLDE